MVSRTITKTNGNNKVIDFRDNLNLASVDNYAFLHGSGGNKGEIKSTIKCCICDFSKGTGDKSVSAFVNFDIDTIYQLKGAAERCLSTPDVGYEASGNAIANLKSAIAGLDRAEQLISQSKPVDKNVTGWIKEKISLAAKDIKPVSEFSYKQEKVDVYKEQSGKAPVSIVQIAHQSEYNGKPSRYPWFIKITNGIAPITQKEGGTVTYSAKEMKVEKDVFINVSNADMYKMMLRITRYIEIWEQSVCIPNVLKGLQKRQEEYLEQKNNKT